MVNITITDVAKHAGVSKTTVSRVLNNHAYVSEDVRLRVQQSMTALGYAPKRAARQLKLNSSQTIGLIIPDIQNTVFQSIARGVEDVAYANKLNVVLCNTDDNPERQNAYLRMMLSEAAEGLVVVPTGSNDGEALARVRSGGIPIILIDRDLNNFEADTIKVDNVYGARVATRHLIELGLRRIAIIVGTQDLTPTQERLQGYKDAMIECIGAIDQDLIRFGNFKYDDGYNITRELIESVNPPEAIFVTNNLMTMGALRALHEIDIPIPERIAVVGFDDMPWAADFCPPLTAVWQPAYELGQQAVELLLKRIENPERTYQKVILKPRLIIRESCGAKRQRM